MKNRDFKHVMKLLILHLVLYLFGSVDTSLIEDCPQGQVLHFNPETNKGMCCIPVPLPKGYEALPCAKDGTEDHVQRCQNGTHQPDETYSNHMPQCIADPQCTDAGVIKSLKCIDEYCWPVCICSLEDRKCGLDPFDCIDIREINCVGKVLQNCSCAPPDITSTLPTRPPTTNNSSTTDLTTQFSVPTLTTKTWTGSTKTVYKNNTTKDGTDKGDKWKIAAVCIGCAVLLLFVVVVLCVRYRLLRKDSSLRSQDEPAGHEMEEQPFLSQDSLVRSQGEPAGREMEEQPFLSQEGQDIAKPKGSSMVSCTSAIKQDVIHASRSSYDSSMRGQGEPAGHEVEAEANLSWVSGQEPARHEVEAKPFLPEENDQGEPAGHEEEAQAILSLALPQDFSGAQPNSFEEPHLNLSVNWPTLPSSLFHSSNNTTDHQEVPDESERHQTNVKVVVSNENLGQEEGYHSGAVDNSSQYHVGAEPTLSSNGLWSDFDSSILHSSETSDIPQTRYDILQAEFDIPQAGSDVPQTGSDVPQARSDIPHAEFDILQVGSDVPQAGSDVPQVGSDVPQTGSDVPHAEFDMLQAGSDVPQTGSDVPQEGSDVPQAGSDVPQARSDVPQTGSDVPQEGSDVPQAGSDVPQAGSDIPQREGGEEEDE